MIYPSEFPATSLSTAEQKVYQKLSSLAGKYDIFYSRRFVALNKFEKPEYEIDFIICLPNKAILCLEVKGGIIHYDGDSGSWYQNSHELKKAPDIQASSATHSLIKRYKDLSGNIPIGWALCFTDCEVPTDATLPLLLTPEKTIDQKGLLYLDKALDAIFQSIFEQYPEKIGCKDWQYNIFKNDLLRGIGFVQILGTRVKHDDEKFIQLAEDQLSVFNHVVENNKILVYGPAGCGKTIIARTLAQEAATDNKKVFFLCFNRTLANKLAYEVGIRDNELITVNTFHSFAKRTIELLDPDWWGKPNKTNEEFWDIEVPAKLDSLLNWQAEYDYLIIDEGQDFKEFWFELLFRLVVKNGKIIIFLDKMQDIFNRDVLIPSETSFLKYTLKENCRNTKKIVAYLEQTVGEKILTKDNPVGDAVTIHKSKNETELQKQLIDDIKELLRDQRISSDQILILLNTEKDKSSISNLNKIGNLPLKSLDNKARFDRDTIYFTSINTFKGLELDIIFILDVQFIDASERKKKLYTEASRAKHKLFTYEITKQ